MRLRHRLLALALACACGCRSKPSPSGPGRGAPTVAVASGPSEGPPRDGGTIRVHVEAEPPSLNPLVEHDAWTVWLTLGAIYEPLVREGPEAGRFLPALATAWSQPDDRTLRITLRGGVTWHDGHPFGADDVVATFDRLREPGVSPDARADFEDLLSVEKAGATEVVLRFGRPAPLALQALAHLAVLPAHHFAPGDLRRQAASRAPVGTGPFRFVSWETGRRIVIERAPGYWGPRPHLDRVELVVVRDREAAFELARRGALDVLWQLTPSQVDRAAADPALASARIVPWHLLRYGFIVWNLRRPGLGDRRVRQALAMLTDRARYLKVVYRGRAVPVTGPYPLGSASYDASIAPWPFDPARARALLDQAGVVDRDGDGIREIDGKPFRLTFLLSAGSTTLEPLLTMMQEEFAKAGIVLEAAPVDWAAMLDRLRNHAFDVSSLQWVMQPVQDNWKEFHSSQAEHGQNYGGFKDPEADRILDALRVTPIGGERARLDRAFHRLVHEDQPYAFLGNPEVDSLVAARVHGYAPRAVDLGFGSMWVDVPPAAGAQGAPAR